MLTVIPIEVRRIPAPVVTHPGAGKIREEAVGAIKLESREEFIVILSRRR